MPAPRNLFKAALARREQLIGLWLALGEPTTTEIAAQAGFDWLLIDAEHAPNDLRDILAQLRVLHGHPVFPVVRPPSDDRVTLKRYLDIGAQSLLIPMIECAAQAHKAVRSLRYPPAGARGVGAALARASSYGTVPDYLPTAADELCLLLQLESRTGLAALDEILGIDGVDGVFIGPADLAADMGHPGRPDAPEVQDAVTDALSRIDQSRKASGILTSNLPLAARYRDMGVNFLAIGSDVGAYTRGLRDLREQFSSNTG